jgi:serine/threonine protein kinase
LNYLQLNVLIDDSTKAVLCDFGLSRIKADTASHTVRADGGSINTVGSRNWMAPEQLTGGRPKKPWDIYAFGMTIFEVGRVLIESQMAR